MLNLLYLIFSSGSLTVSSWDLIHGTEAWVQQLRDVVRGIRELILGDRSSDKEREGEDEAMEKGLGMDFRLLEGNVDMVEEALREIRGAGKG